MTKKMLCVILCTLICGISFQLYADIVPEKFVTPHNLSVILSEDDEDYNITVNTQKNAVVVSNKNMGPITIIVTSKDEKVIVFVAKFKCDMKLSKNQIMEKINQFNQNSNIRIVLLENGNFRFDYIFPFSGGMSEEAFLQAVEMFSQVIANWKEKFDGTFLENVFTTDQNKDVKN